MSKRIFCWLAISALALALLATGVAAQTDVLPDAGVRGSGVVTFGSDANIAQFDVNVTRVGTSLYGGLKWVEGVPTATTRPNVVITKRILSMRFLAANHIVVEALGYYNDRPANIRFEALDDLAGDYVHITATTIVPTGSLMPTLIYDKQGGVAKGNIVVFGKPASGYFSKGYGAIPLSSTFSIVGQFNFSAQSIPLGTSGTLQYAVFNTMLMSPMSRPSVLIQVKKWDTLKVDGNTAVMVGIGTLNGTPSRVTVSVADNIKPAGTPITDPTILRDTFKIEAVPIVATLIAVKPYAASGPVFRGDLVVGEFQTATIN